MTFFDGKISNLDNENKVPIFVEEVSFMDINWGMRWSCAPLFLITLFKKKV
jgi:hypothetical protein